MIMYSSGLNWRRFNLRTIRHSMFVWELKSLVFKSVIKPLLANKWSFDGFESYAYELYWRMSIKYIPVVKISHRLKIRSPLKSIYSPGEISLYNYCRLVSFRQSGTTPLFVTIWKGLRLASFSSLNISISTFYYHQISIVYSNHALISRD